MSENINANFSIRITNDDLLEPFLNSTKVKIRCEYNCDCYQFYKPNDIFYLETTEPITKKDILDCLIYNGYSTSCNHNYLDDVFIVSQSIVIPIFGK